MGVRVISVDWSGAQVAAQQKIWLAEVIDGRLVRLENGRSREMLTDHLIALAKADPQMVVGLDFAFSLPAWYLDHLGLVTAHELWALADREADAWLAACASPFWGKPGVPRWTDVPHHFRQTELDVPKTAGIQPKSVFQVGGAGAVGTGSLRGMRTLHRLHAAGFSIWPFGPAGWPRVVEIYPRLLTGKVVKSSEKARAAYLVAHHPELDGALLARAGSSEDAFDAAVSALVMAAHIDELTNVPAVMDLTTALEGLIWHPKTAGSIAGAPVAEARGGETGHPRCQAPDEGDFEDPNYPSHHAKPFPVEQQYGESWLPDGTVIDNVTGEVLKRGMEERIGRRCRNGIARP